MERPRAIDLVQDAIREVLYLDPSNYALEDSYDVLGADSLDVVMVCRKIEEHLDGHEIDNVDMDKMKTVQDLVLLLELRYGNPVCPNPHPRENYRCMDPVSGLAFEL
jgi:acyl carrier protein